MHTNTNSALMGRFYSADRGALLYHCQSTIIVQFLIYPPAVCSPCLLSIAAVERMCSEVSQGNIDPNPLWYVVLFMQVVIRTCGDNVWVVIGQDETYCNRQDPA
jgi:hypothetical protein